MDIVNKYNSQSAHDFAKEKHDATGATRKHSGAPYIVHPEGVAEIVQAYGGTEDQVMIAYLHDTVEDTDTTIEEITELFGEDVARAVDALTNDKDMPQGKEEYMNHKLVTLPKDALFVKLADILYNSLDYPNAQQKSRLIKNINYLVDNRELDADEEELVGSIYMALAS